MPHTRASRPTSRRRLRPAVIPLVIAGAAIAAALVYQSAGAHTSVVTDAPSRIGPVGRQDPSRSVPAGEHPTPDLAPATTTRAAIGVDDGALPDGVTVLDPEYAGIANLDRDLAAALRDATRDARAAGIELSINSGWRSASYQDRLLRDAVAEYGSEREAARWVATAETSPHVSGDAVDLGPEIAQRWLSTRGARYGLCQVYRNEPWHYELRPDARRDGCPGMYADPTHDPRMRP